MKRILFILFVCIYAVPVEAQLLDRIRNKVEQKVGDKIDQSIDKATQKKKPVDAPVQNESENQKDTPAEISSNQAPEIKRETANTSISEIHDINSYSKFDFISGEKVIISEDFSQEALGDFPTNWNTRSSAELVTINNRSGKWLRMAQTGIFYPEDFNSNLPENFTLQLELMAN
ncbi:MAG: hypothetical protein ABIN24_01745, partial [Dyadobacter sp.]